ncbi:unnamed protein product [Effrenium voratum]|uniref:Ammonium transporter AmtB-like domain-containing protein n=1 Tax=Effrenium voratum TaxID=2562239 RepID=A0AA36N095_9DINO|nr:unnamed protein product [Effrenium voratum]
MRSSGLVLLLAAPALVAGDTDAIKAQIQTLRSQLKSQREQIEEQQQLLTEADGRRLQTLVTQTTVDTQIAALQATRYGFNGAMDSLWLCLCGALVMFMHAGFAMLETGSCRAKNASNVLMKNLVNVCVGTLGWWLTGWAFAYGTQSGTALFGSSGFVGEGFYTKDASGKITPVTCTSEGCQSTMLSWFFQWAFCTAGATIVSGAVAERVKGPTYAAFAFVMTSFIYPMVVAWSWGGGWISTLFDVGYMDFAGSGVVHLTGGVAGLAGTVVLGPRKGRFVNPEDFEPHNLPLVVFGTFALWFGWYGFNPGSTLGMHDGATGALAAQVAMNTTLAAATGGISVFIIRYAILRKYDVGGLCNGILAGLVSITAGCGNMESGSAFATGLVGAMVYQGASMLLQKLKIDDPVDAVPVHGFCGIWGLLATALFDWGKGVDHYHGWSGWGCMQTADKSSCQTGIGGTAIGANLIMALVIIAWSGSISALTFALLKWWGALRIDEETEEMGMDAKSHSPAKAYALDFPNGQLPEAMKWYALPLLATGAAVAAGQSELLAELKQLESEVNAQQQLIKDQQELLDSYESHQSRRLQTMVNETYFNSTVEALQAKDYSLGGAMDSAWLCLCGALVMFMHAGFAMLETGCCRAKNASNVLMKNLVNVCVGTLGWWSLGWAFAYGAQNGNGFIGTTGFFGWDFYSQDATTGVITPVTCNGDGCQSTMLSWFFQWAFCTAGATIVSGAVAERVKSPTYAAYAFFMTSFIYPVVVAWTWGGGWLASIFDVGYMDFAGSGVVHLTGGVSGLMGTIVLGPRKGRFVSPEDFEPHNLPLVVLGTFALWFGWYGFNPGSTLGMKSANDGAMAAQVAMNTTLAAATGGITVFILRYCILRKYDVGGLCNGILAGLVSITAGCGNMECGSAVTTGFIGAFVYQAASMLLQKLKIDDPVDAAPVHGFCGIWGALATALFDWGKGIDNYHGWSGWDCMAANGSCRPGIGGTAIGAQLIMIIMIIVWAGGLSSIAFFLLKLTGTLRISEDVEEVGMDSKHHSPPKAYAMQ